MRAIFTLLTAAAVIISAGHAGRLAAGNPEAVEIPQKEGGQLKAMLFRPEGQGPFPAVVALHNCTGLSNSAGAFGARYRDWGERLAKNGYVVLMPDSNGSRGHRQPVRDALALDPQSTASGWPTPMPPAPGCNRNRGSRPTASRCSAGRAAPSPRCGRCARGRSRHRNPRTVPISAPRSRSIRAAGGSATPPGARGCRR